VIGLHSAILDRDEKLLVKDALVLYVQNLQKKFYRDKIIDETYYNSQMKRIDAVAEILALKDLYKQ
jgi:hypothetical protein|tara:strand:- start:68 stop:265 length:198 start_codon:yes stop_codon:yes gene_type:complete